MHDGPGNTPDAAPPSDGPEVDSPPTVHTINVQRTGSGHGTVTADAGGIACGTMCLVRLTVGTIVQLTAVPDASAAFAGWSGPCSGTNPVCSFVVGLGA